jgi:hypothetical protein
MNEPQKPKTRKLREPSDKMLDTVKLQRGTIEGIFLCNGKAGESFYSEKEDKRLTALASYHRRLVTTEKFIAVTAGKAEPRASFITKVTILR